MFFVFFLPSKSICIVDMSATNESDLGVGTRAPDEDDCNNVHIPGPTVRDGFFFFFFFFVVALVLTAGQLWTGAGFFFSLNMC